MAPAARERNESHGWDWKIIRCWWTNGQLVTMNNDIY